MAANTDYVMQHLQYWCQGRPSALAIQVCGMLNILESGLHHCDNGQMVKVDWTNDLWIEVKYRWNLATFDGNKLTRLVFLSHDFGVRLEINPCNMQYLRLIFHQRHKRDGHIFERHPTLEQAVEQWRQINKTRELPKREMPNE